MIAIGIGLCNIGKNLVIQLKYYTLNAYCLFTIGHVNYRQQQNV